MTRQELLSQLNNAQNNFMYGVAGLALLSQSNSKDNLESLIFLFRERSFSILNESSAVFSELQNSTPSLVASFPLKEVSDYISACNKEDLTKCQQQFFQMLVRAFIRESFEAIKKYCDDSHSQALFESQSWYHFGKIVRNCFSHDNSIQYNKYEKKRLPISWRGKRFTIGMNGKPLNSSIFDLRDVFFCIKI